eukprot:9520244-Heterocapsa_arctica.AAC.1
MFNAKGLPELPSEVEASTGYGEGTARRSCSASRSHRGGSTARTSCREVEGGSSRRAALPFSP